MEPLHASGQDNVPNTRVDNNRSFGGGSSYQCYDLAIFPSPEFLWAQNMMAQKNQDEILVNSYSLSMQQSHQIGPFTKGIDHNNVQNPQSSGQDFIHASNGPTRYQLNQTHFNNAMD